MNRSHRGLRSAAAAALCGLFAVLCMGLALLSSGVYRSVSAAADENMTRRTGLSYLVNQVRRADEVGGVLLGSFGGSDALFLTEHLDGSDYVTVLYCYRDCLRELYAESPVELTPADGMEILDLQALAIARQGDTLTFTVTAPNGTVSTASVTPRCGVQEAAA